MKYYRIVLGGSIVGVCDSDGFRRYQSKHGIFLQCDGLVAECIQCGDNKLYYNDWFNPLAEGAEKAAAAKGYSLEAAGIEEISESDYKALSEALKTEGELFAETEENIAEEVTVSENVSSENVSLEYVKSIKIKEMSKACNLAIINGFDLELSDGEKHHFDYTLYDQINLMFLQQAISLGETKLIYHASEEICKYFTTEDILLIIETGNNLKTYNTTYFNSLKQYVKTLENIDEISSVVYGMDIPDKYMLEVINDLIINK